MIGIDSNGPSVSDFVSAIASQIPECDCLVAEIRSNATSVKYIDRFGNELSSVSCEQDGMDLVSALGVAARAAQSRPRSLDLSSKIRRLAKQVRSAGSEDESLLLVARFLSVVSPSILAQERCKRNVDFERKRRLNVEGCYDELKLQIESAIEDGGDGLQSIAVRAIRETDYATR
jgi:hypothetical protein